MKNKTNQTLEAILMSYVIDSIKSTEKLAKILLKEYKNLNKEIAQLNKKSKNATKKGRTN